MKKKSSSTQVRNNFCFIFSSTMSAEQASGVSEATNRRFRLAILRPEGKEVYDRTLDFFSRVYLILT